MTIVAAYRYGPFAIVMSDFRITHKQGDLHKHFDACMKYTQIGTHMGMFFAGDVGYIQSLIPVIRRIQSQLTIENVLDDNGLLRQELLAASQQLASGENKAFMAIGFLFDEPFSRNEMFKLEGVAGTTTLRVEKLKSGECTIIGEGINVPDLQENLKNMGRSTSSYKKHSFLRRGHRWKGNKYDQKTTAHALESKLKQMFRECGTAVYISLGISPFFITSIIGKTGFYMKGETLEDRYITTDFDENGPVQSTKSVLTIEWDRVKHALFLSDGSNQLIRVQEIENYIMPTSPISLNTNPNLFFDPSDFGIIQEDIFIMNQWVMECMIIRSVYRQRWHNKGFFDPNKENIASSTEKPPIDIKRYIRSGEDILFVAVPLAKEFEESVANHMFDHEWLVQYVKNYESFYK